MHKKLQIVYKNNKPYGIRDDTGFLFFFSTIQKYSGQEERYRQEVEEQYQLADYLLASLRARANTSVEPTEGSLGDVSDSLVVSGSR
jgi:hypothetical protein